MMSCVPICPSCSAMIHTGAEDQCPVCGYSLKRAQAMFGRGKLPFTRVVDDAGALKNNERRQLMDALEDMERNLPPIALGIYITSHGQPKGFRAHAHWVLNQAEIHHPSFGRREQARAVEDAELQEGIARGSRVSSPARYRFGESLRARLRDWVHPYPPPVRQEWLLILVLDVQLELACFTWGYMLDPYVNPERINSAVLGARLYFRERAMVVGLRRVMKAAVNQIAAQSHRVNRRLRGEAASSSSRVVIFGVALGAAVFGTAAVAQNAVVHSIALLGKDTTEDVAKDAEGVPGTSSAGGGATHSTAVADTGTVAKNGGAATLLSPPRWGASDYQHLLAGELVGCYTMLGGERPVVAVPPDSPAGRHTTARSAADTSLFKRYYRDYVCPNSPEGVIDPQGLLSSPQRADIDFALHLHNAHVPYTVYIAFYRLGQQLPIEMSAGAMVQEIARPGEYAVLLLYGWGDSPVVELGYHELRPGDDVRRDWQQRVEYAARLSSGTGGVLAALAALQSCLTDVSRSLPPLEQRTDLQVPLIPIQMREDEDAEEVTRSDEIKRLMADPRVRDGVRKGVIFLFVAGLLFFIFWLRRRSGHLRSSLPDKRLGSPYGAGVSRNVHYLEGRESGSPPRYF